MDTYNTNHIKSALIVGAGHGIGYAIVETLLKTNHDVIVHATYSTAAKANDLLLLSQHYPNRLVCVELNATCEIELEKFFLTYKNSYRQPYLDLCLVCIGVLHDAQLKPEKSLKDVNRDALLRYFEINAIITPLVAKHCKSLFSTHTTSVFAALSAKVGSIADNRLGGWYGYRASKAALNMFIKNIAIEFKQAHLKTVVLSIHPGTTNTALAHPFIPHLKHKIWSSEETAEHILSIVNHLQYEETGNFKNWDGTTLPW